MITPSEYLAKHPENQRVQPCDSSWGDKGYYEVWLNGGNDWIYRHLHILEERMVELAHRHPVTDGLKRRALNQAAREVLLAQSSDWGFLMTAGTAGSYARKRTEAHINHFLKLYDQIQSGQIDPDNLKTLEERDNLFPELDYHVYSDGFTKEVQKV